MSTHRRSPAPPFPRRRRRPVGTARRCSAALTTAFVVLATSGCNNSETGLGGGQGATSNADIELSASVDAIDRRPDLLVELGPPESFVITADEVGGRVSRFESWQYWSSGTQIDLVDGEIAWNLGLDPLPDGSFLPLFYSPDEFVLLSSIGEVTERLGDVEFTAVDGAAADLGVEGAELWAGEQLLLGFVDDRLVHVQTYPLAPEA